MKTIPYPVKSQLWNTGLMEMQVQDGMLLV